MPDECTYVYGDWSYHNDKKPEVVDLDSAKKQAGKSFMDHYVYEQCKRAFEKKTSKEGYGTD